MADNVYKVVELAGSSEKSVEDAVNTAIARAGQSLHELGWFEVIETRGRIDGNRVAEWQVVLKVGFTLEDG
jgi:flavin-binding protein dodecin